MGTYVSTCGPCLQDKAITMGTCFQLSIIHFMLLVQQELLLSVSNLVCLIKLNLSQGDLNLN